MASCEVSPSGLPKIWTHRRPRAVSQREANSGLPPPSIFPPALLQSFLFFRNVPRLPYILFFWVGRGVERRYVVDQLQCLGILQTCEVLKVGMPTRVSYTELKEVRPACGLACPPERKALGVRPEDLVCSEKSAVCGDKHRSFLCWHAECSRTMVFSSSVACLYSPSKVRRRIRNCRQVADIVRSPTCDPRCRLAPAARPQTSFVRRIAPPRVA